MPKKNKKRTKKSVKPEKEKKEQSRSNKHKLTKKSLLVIIALLFISLAVLALFLLSEFGVIQNFSFLKDFSLEPQLFTLKDECSLIVGQLIHTIKDPESCELKCKNNCNIREMKFHDSEFTERQSDCHKCECYCR